MPAHLMGAVLTLRTEGDSDGYLHLIEPLPPQVVPRPPVGDVQTIRLPRFSAVLVLWGGEPGPFRILTAWLYPPEDDRPEVALRSPSAQPC